MDQPYVDPMVPLPTAISFQNLAELFERWHQSGENSWSVPTKRTSSHLRRGCTMEPSHSTIFSVRISYLMCVALSAVCKVCFA